ncbi:MAG TPA: class I adenylate-forming enzyme family protein [Sphingobium sp.]|uniref:class I adenylate-forming enzyme family protein n=1 Tax=Sphingobium sp. TaxID=1912891 RepID=UPI002ED36EF7
MNPRSLKTLPELIRSAAAAFGDETAVTLTGDSLPDDSVSFRGLDERSAEIARALLARGVGKGSRVGFIYGNSPSFAIIFAAIARIGAIAIPISTLIKANELVRVLRQSDIGALFVQRTLLRHDYVERLCEALPALRDATGPDLRIADIPYLRWIVSTGEGLPPGIVAQPDFLSGAKTVDDIILRAAEAEVHSTDQIVEIYTSGSMALPKGVRHLHGPVMARAAYVAEMTGARRGDRIDAVLPMFWVGGLMMFLLPGWVAGRITACTEGTKTSSRHAMGSVLAEEDLKLLAGAKPYWALGMSETFGPYSYGDEFRAPGYPVCAPLDHAAEQFEIRVVGEDGSAVGDGEVGEIQVRGYALTPGLHKLEREGYFTPDGFYHTGDLGVRDGGRIHFVGRNGDIIKANGSNVSPAEVEMELQQLDGIHSAYVVGIPDVQRGQLVVAAVVARDGETIDIAATEAAMKARLSSFKLPRAYVELKREDVPMLPSNKVARRQIETLMIGRLGRG